jgi:nucleoid-associated protein YgaU
MGRGEDRQTHVNGSLSVQNMDGLEAHGLPPRRLRHKQKKYPLQAVLGTGIVLFGALFFGMVGLELYRAHHSPPAAVEEPPEAVEEQAGRLPSAQPLSAANPVQPKDSPQTSAGKDSSQTRTTVTQPEAKDAFAGKAVTAANASAANTAPPKQPSATPAKPKALRHVVKKGETLYQLSRKYYGNQSGVKRIARYNGFGIDHELSEGEVVLIPLTQ